MSENNCPEVLKVDYDLDSSTVIKGVDFSLYEDQIKAVAGDCPVKVIKFEEG